MAILAFVGLKIAFQEASVPNPVPCKDAKTISEFIDISILADPKTLTNDIIEQQKEKINAALISSLKFVLVTITCFVITILLSFSKTRFIEAFPIRIATAFAQVFSYGNIAVEYYNKEPMKRKPGSHDFMKDKVEPVIFSYLVGLHGFVIPFIVRCIY